MMTRKKAQSTSHTEASLPAPSPPLPELIVTISPDAPSSVSPTFFDTRSVSPLPAAEIDHRFRWSDDARMKLIKTCHRLHVWDLPYGQVLKTWDSIADEINKQIPSSIVSASGSGCQTEYKRLIKEQKKKDVRELGESGTIQAYTDKERLLLDCIQLTKTVEKEKQEEKEQQEKYEAEVTSAQQRIRQHTMTFLGKRSNSIDSFASSSSSSSSFSSSSSSSSFVGTFSAHVVSAAPQTGNDSDVEC
jgi:hypothetical protein